MPSFVPSSTTVQSCLEPPAASSGWASLCAPEPAATITPKPWAPARRVRATARGGKKNSLDMCTETLGCETGAVDPAGDEPSPRLGCGAEEIRRRRARKAAAAAATAFPPPLTTLGRASRVRIVHERQGGRLAMYYVRMPGVEADRSGGRLRIRLLPGGNARAEPRQEPRETEEEEEEKEVAVEVAKYTRAGRCMQAGGRRWPEEQPEVVEAVAVAGQAFWVASS